MNRSSILFGTVFSALVLVEISFPLFSGYNSSGHATIASESIF